MTQSTTKLLKFETNSTQSHLIDVGKCTKTHKAIPATCKVGSLPSQTVTSHFQGPPAPPAFSQAS